MLDVIFFITAGMIFGIIFGLVPGIHPNMIILLVPFFISSSLQPPLIISFFISMAMTNIFFDFIPSILFGAPEEDTSMSVLPGHRLLMEGHGYVAVKFCVVGCAGAIVICAAIFPFLMIIVPVLYLAITNYIWIFLTAISFVIIWSNSGYKKLAGLLCFFGAGIIGLMTEQMPISNTLTLFPIFSGFFGISMLVLQINQKTNIPKQSNNEMSISIRTRNRSIFFGTLGGIFSGFLPGAGTSQITAMATLEKNEKSFLMTAGAIAAANMIISVVSLWLIKKPRSGIAVALDQITTLGLNEVILILGVSLFVCGISTILVLKTTKHFIRLIEKINYSYISIAIIIMISALTFIFTGFFGMLLLITCTSMGIFVNTLNVRRAVLMGVLLLPTIIFYLGL